MSATKRTPRWTADLRPRPCHLRPRPCHLRPRPCHLRPRPGHPQTRPCRPRTRRCHPRTRRCHPRHPIRLRERPGPPERPRRYRSRPWTRRPTRLMYPPGALRSSTACRRVAETSTTTWSCIPPEPESSLMLGSIEAKTLPVGTGTTSSRTSDAATGISSVCWRVGAPG